MMRRFGGNMAAHFKDLVVWQKAMGVAKEIIVLTRDFPKVELYGLGSQIRNAAVSIPSNIAEGQQRYSVPDFRHFLRIARGSLGELETQLILARDLGYVSSEVLTRLTSEIDVIGRLLNGLIKSLNAKAASA
jgi:four helix bundle protein